MSLRFVIKMCAHRYLLCEHFACSYLSYAEKKKLYQLSKRPIITDFYTPTNYILPCCIYILYHTGKHLLHFEYFDPCCCFWLNVASVFAAINIRSSFFKNEIVLLRTATVDKKFIKCYTYWHFGISSMTSEFLQECWIRNGIIIKFPLDNFVSSISKNSKINFTEPELSLSMVNFANFVEIILKDCRNCQS